ncbi:MAG: DUF6293 family protein, partial [Candidatus Saliniplasma sp.]
MVIKLASPNLRVVIDCVTFETVKIIDPAKHYKADIVYLFHKALDKPYSDFLEKVKSELDDSEIHYKTIRAEINDFSEIIKELMKVIESERNKGNHVYVNISAGTHVFCSAALIACMMKGGNPFYAPTKNYTVKDDKIEDTYFEDGDPVGLAEEVEKPQEILCFNLPNPDEKLIKGLKIWKDEKEKGSLMTSSSIIEKFADEGLMEDIFEDNREKVSQNSTMKYRRNFLEKWLENGWLKKIERGRY